MKEIPTPEKMKFQMADAYRLVGARTPLELNTLYDEEDQRLMHAGAWDYNNPDLVVNKIKKILEVVDTTTLNEEESAWRNNILWFWYHHAISCAIWRYKDKSTAQRFSESALKLQSSDHPNQITQLFYFLTHDQLDLANQWLLKITNEAERETGQYLIDTYQAGGFYKEQLPPK